MKADVLLDLFFGDAVLADRVAAIARAGWSGVETWKGGDADELKEIGHSCRENNMDFVSIVINGPNDGGVAPADAGNLSVFLDRVDQYSDNALAAGCSAGIVTTGNRVSGRDYYQQKQALVAALVKAAEIAERKGFTLNLEPLNDKVNHPGYFLISREEAIDVVRQVNSPNVRILYDLYHQQVMTGDHLAFLAAHIGWVGHFHAAGVPGRHEIFRGEMDYPYVVRRISEMGYEGWMGLEYMPELEAAESLTETLKHLRPALG